MALSAKENDLVKMARHLSWAMWFFIWAAILIFLSLWTLPTPIFEGFSLAVVVGYFISLAGIILTSSLWLLKFNKVVVEDDGFVSAKRAVLISLILSIVAALGSGLFLMFALAVTGLFNMI